MLASFQSFALCYLVIAGFSASQQLMLSDVDYFINSRRIQVFLSFNIVGVFVFFYLLFCVFQFGIVSFVEFFILHTPKSDVKCCTLLHKVKSYPSVFTYNCVSVFSIFCIVFVFFYLVFCVFQFVIVSFVEFFILHTPKSDVKCCTLLHKVKSYPSVFTYNCVSVFSIFCIVSFGNCSFLHTTAIGVK